jgi:tetratricopeptide (TPR) repeat protein
MFGRADRRFSEGQRALARRDFPGAERLLGEAAAADPQRAHIRLYLAHALAEQERRAEAERALAVAIGLRPGAFVFPLHGAIIALDVGDLDRARELLGVATTLARANRLVAGYGELLHWTARGGPPPAAVARAAGELSPSFGARVLLHAAELLLDTHGVRATVALLEPANEPAGIPMPLRIGALRHRDRVLYAEHLLERGRFDDALCYLTGQPVLMADPRVPALLERARRSAVRSVDEALAACAPGRRGALLLQRYEAENDLGDIDAVARTLGAWREDYVAAGAPARERALAAAVIRRLAIVELERGRHEAALELCAASRHARPERETAGVEALARLGLGQRRAARHAFEDFLKNALFPLDRRLGAVPGSPA